MERESLNCRASLSIFLGVVAVSRNERVAVDQWLACRLLDLQVACSNHDGATGISSLSFSRKTKPFIFLRSINWHQHQLRRGRVRLQGDWFHRETSPAKSEFG